MLRPHSAKIEQYVNGILNWNVIIRHCSLSKAKLLVLLVSSFSRRNFLSNDITFECNDKSLFNYYPYNYYP